MRRKELGVIFQAWNCTVSNACTIYVRVCPWENQAGGETAQITDFAQTPHTCWVWWVKWSWQKIRSKYFIFFKLGTPSKNGRFLLIFSYLISCLWFRISTTRKAMWKWTSWDRVLRLSVSKQWYSFQLDNLISLRDSILSKVHISYCCE